MEFENVLKVDKEVYNALIAEKGRQQNCLELIASENFTSLAVMEAMGSYHTNKYAEGYPGNRYYAGCEFVDITENLARDRACKLFNAEHANVQPHSGAQANEAVYIACLKTGDKVLTMTLNSGAHITHMSSATAQSRFYTPIYYDVNPNTYLIDYDEVEKLALENLPRLIICGASAYPRQIDFKKFREITDKVNEVKSKNGELSQETKCLLMCDMAHIAGLVAAGLHPSPFPYADVVTTTTHKTLRGPRGGITMCKKEHAQGIDKAVFPGIQGGPLEHVIAAKAVALKEALSDEFKEYGKNIIENSKALSLALMDEGIDIVGGVSENHLMTVDLRKLNKTGKDVANMLERIGITANKNTVPNDPQSPFVTSGVRIGVPAVTTRGFKTEDMKTLAKIIADGILEREDEAVLRQRSLELCKKHPLYPDMLCGV